jgi:hypothetical protein
MKNYFVNLLKLVSINFLIISSSYSLTKIPKIVFLTSFSSIQTKSYFGRKEKDYLNKYYSYEKIFKRKFNKMNQSENFLIEIHHKVNAEKLYQTLKDPSVYGVYWLSHAVRSSNIPGVSHPGKIVDFNNEDITILFKEAHSNMRFISLMGCETIKLINDELLPHYKKSDSPII